MHSLVVIFRLCVCFSIDRLITLTTLFLIPCFSASVSASFSTGLNNLKSDVLTPFYSSETFQNHGTLLPDCGTFPNYDQASSTGTVIPVSE